MYIVELWKILYLWYTGIYTIPFVYILVSYILIVLLFVICWNKYKAFVIRMHLGLKVYYFLYFYMVFFIGSKVLTYNARYIRFH